MSISKIVAAAKSALIRLAAAKSYIKNNALAEIANDNRQRNVEIVSANKEDPSVTEKNNPTASLPKRPFSLIRGVSSHISLDSQKEAPKFPVQEIGIFL